MVADYSFWNICPPECRHFFADNNLRLGRVHSKAPTIYHCFVSLHVKKYPLENSFWHFFWPTGDNHESYLGSKNSYADLDSVILFLYIFLKMVRKSISIMVLSIIDLTDMKSFSSTLSEKNSFEIKCLGLCHNQFEVR